MRDRREKRVLLMEPPFCRLYHDNYALIKYPLALGYLSGAVEKWTDWRVETYNADFNTDKCIVVANSFLIGPGYQNYLQQLENPTAPVWDEIRATLKAFQADVVGISAKSQNFMAVAQVAAMAKELLPGVTVVVGGAHPSMAGEKVLEVGEIDVAVVGEGEETLVELLKALEKGAPLVDVPGLIFRGEKGIVRTPPRPFMADLDILPFPMANARKVLKDYDRYPPDAFSRVFAARGCPYSCTFCGSRNIWSQKVRFRSAQNVIDEIKMLQGMGIHYIHFDDDTFGVKISFIRELCNGMIEQCPDLTWSCEIVVGLIREEVVDLMARSGCKMVMLGIESGNDGMLKKIRKNITMDEAHQAVDLLKSRNIEVQTFFMVGFPDETEETLQDTQVAMKNIRSDKIAFSIFTPYPGTELFQVCHERGLVEDDFNVSLYNHQSPENHFTPHIPKARFQQLVAETVRIVDRKNTLKQFRRVLKLLKEQGVAYTASQIFRFVWGRLKAR
ncbi:MAG: radical SAM protein [Magnetococcales bacterium]|nr:radical SAM protein [Magnetococcales bacterium]